MKLHELLVEADAHYIFYHGTTNHEQIELNGFKIQGTGGHRNSSGPFGDGIYLSPTETLAKNYTKKSGKVLKISARLKLKHMDVSEWLAEIKSEKFKKWYDGQDRTETAEHYMSKWYHDQGYDGIFIHVGSDLDQAIVYTPEKLRIIQ